MFLFHLGFSEAMADDTNSSYFLFLFEMLSLDVMDPRCLNVFTSFFVSFILIFTGPCSL